MEEAEKEACLKLAESDSLEEQGQKKPRRKDTPVLTAPPPIPGMKVMKDDCRLIHLEDEDKEAKS